MDVWSQRALWRDSAWILVPAGHSVPAICHCLSLPISSTCPMTTLLPPTWSVQHASLSASLICCLFVVCWLCLWCVCVCGVCVCVWCGFVQRVTKLHWPTTKTLWLGNLTAAMSVLEVTEVSRKALFQKSRHCFRELHTRKYGSKRIRRPLR